MLLVGDVTLTSVLTDITSVMTNLFTGVGSIFDMIMSTPLLFIMCVIPIIGAVVGFTRRIINL